jgi:peptidoglycan/LPS O-acetylase OafA/YrhL
MKNNFDLLRLVFALQVVMIHVLFFNQAGDSPWRQWLLNPTNRSPVAVPVQCFFVISGFLVYSSWLRCRTLREYASKRFRRIYPAYVAAVLLGALVSWLCYDHSTPSFFSRELARYFVGQLTFLTNLQNTLPGVFADHPYPYINGALWTLKVEVMFYCAVPLVAWVVARGKPWCVFLVLYGLAEAFCAWCLARNGDGAAAGWAAQLPGQFAFFVAGMAGWHYRDWFGRYAKSVLLASLLGYAAAEASGLGFLRPASLGGIVLYLATGFRYLGNAGRYGDLSYGVYIYHFPILHMLFHMGLMGTSPWLGGTLAILATLAAAWLSWWVIEKRFLLGSSHYRQAEKKVYYPGVEPASRVLPAAKGRHACQCDAAARPASPARR